MRRFSVILMLSLLLLSGCNIEQNQDQNIIGYEYLSKDAEIPDEVNNG